MQKNKKKEMADVPPDEELNPQVSFEKRDVRVKRIVALAAALILTIFISEFVVWSTFHTMRSEVDRSQKVFSPLRVGMPAILPPEPRLQGAPGHPKTGPEDLKMVRDEAEARLNSYGWVNQATGTVHIPIQQAMDLIALNGLPTVPPPKPAAPAHTSPKLAGGAR